MTSGNNFRELDPENMDEDQISDLIAYYNEHDQIAMGSVNSSQNPSFNSSTNEGKQSITTSVATVERNDKNDTQNMEFKSSLISIEISDDSSTNSYDMNPFRNSNSSDS